MLAITRMHLNLRLIMMIPRQINRVDMSTGDTRRTTFAKEAESQWDLCLQPAVLAISAGP
jgi:hypothetical protein